MYAVIETGGKQYRVEVGTELQVELLDAEPGKTITIERVLLVADGDESTIGQPLVADAAVSAEVLDQTRGPKLISFKYRPKARSRVKKGHRQELTVLRIADITLGGKSAAKDGREGRRARPRPSGSASKTPPPRRPRRMPSWPPSWPSAPRRRLPRRRAEGEGRHDRQGQGRAEGQDRDGHEGQGRREAGGQARREEHGRGEQGKDRDEGHGHEAGVRQGRRSRQSRRAEEAAHHEEGRVDEMAHKKAGGSVKNGRDSVGQRLGVKAGDGQLVPAGSIIVRQRGMTFLSGPGTGLGHDYTVFATITGKVKFEHATKNKKRIRVEAVETAAASA